MAPIATGTSDFDIAVIGGGLVGLTIALALSNATKQNDLRIALVAPEISSLDGRTTALLKPSVDMLGALGVWESCQEHSAPLRTMRLIDGTNRLIRAPLTDFKAAELDLDAFGYNIPNSVLIDVLERTITENTNVQRVSGTMSDMSCGPENVTINIDDGSSFTSKLIAAADGRNSPSRRAAGIELDQWDYPQTAIVLSFAHSLPHHGISTEFHRECGPFTIVPLPPTQDSRHRSSLVWVETHDVARQLMLNSLTELAAQIEFLMQSSLGKVTVEAPPQSFPIAGQTARQFAANRVVLLGEAAHVFPPIGAQGFNLGLRDVAALVVVFKKRRNPCFDPGAANLLSAYDARRTADIRLSSNAVDMLNRSLLADFLPIQAARALGLATIGHFGWLKRQIMQRGVSGPDARQRAGNKSGGSKPVAIA